MNSFDVFVIKGFTVLKRLITFFIRRLCNSKIDFTG